MYAVVDTRNATKARGRTSEVRVDPAPRTTPTPAARGFDALFDSAAFDDFTRDPHGFADYDWSDPIDLREFSSRRHVHSTYAAPLA